MQTNNVIDVESNKNDRFYPNAVYCLLEHYQRAYQRHIKGESQLNDSLWPEIAMEMHENFFIFDGSEVKQKFKQLRDIYFNLNDLNALRSFEYFEALHGIYKHRPHEMLLQVADCLVEDDNDEEVKYADEILFNAPSKLVEDCDKTTELWIKIEHQDKQLDGTADDGDVPKLPENNNNSSDMTLSELNAQQERRHREQMKLWRQILRQQENAVQQQELLIETLLKRTQ